MIYLSFLHLYLKNQILIISVGSTFFINHKPACKKLEKLNLVGIIIPMILISQASLLEWGCIFFLNQLIFQKCVNCKIKNLGYTRHHPWTRLHCTTEISNHLNVKYQVSTQYNNLTLISSANYWDTPQLHVSITRDRSAAYTIKITLGTPSPIPPLFFSSPAFRRYRRLLLIAELIFVD